MSGHATDDRVRAAPGEGTTPVMRTEFRGCQEGSGKLGAIALGAPCDTGGCDGDGQINPVDSGIVQSLLGTCEAPRSACP